MINNDKIARSTRSIRLNKEEESIFNRIGGSEAIRTWLQSQKAMFALDLSEDEINLLNSLSKNNPDKLLTAMVKSYLNKKRSSEEAI